MSWLRSPRKIRVLLDQFRRPGEVSGTGRAVLSERLTYLSDAKLSRIEREVRAVMEEDIPGDVIEFGVALGGSAIAIAKICTPGRRFHGFDTFAMIPEPTSEKDDARSKERYRVIRSGRSTGIGGDLYYGYRENLLDEVRTSFARHGIDGGFVTLHKGLFEETWPHFQAQGIAFAHIDCDWYDPVKFCLAAIADKMSAGGTIILDDYHDYGGCKLAVDEFLESRPGFAFDDGPNVILRRRRNA